MDMDLLKLLVAALGGGFTVKVLDILHQEVRRRFEGRVSARRFVDENLDPVLKAADELVGKLRSMGSNDFRTLRNRGDAESGGVGYRDYIGLLYLLARLWASMELFRRGGLSVSVTEDDRGEKLSHFMDCMESRRVRLVDRLSQRAVSDLLLSGEGDGGGMIPFIEFVRLFESDGETERWVGPVAGILNRMQHTSCRQLLLQYGVVVHAMVDTLDPQHRVSRERPSYPHKLSKKTRRHLKYRVFGVYLDFVPEPGKYLGPPKRRS